jgi:hypothetical protein
MQATEAKLSQLCGAVLSGRQEDARALARQFSLPKPKGSTIVRAWFDGRLLAQSGWSRQLRCAGQTSRRSDPL